MYVGLLNVFQIKFQRLGSNQHNGTHSTISRDAMHTTLVMQPVVKNGMLIPSINNSIQGNHVCSAFELFASG